MLRLRRTQAIAALGLTAAAAALVSADADSRVHRASPHAQVALPTQCASNMGGDWACPDGPVTNVRERPNRAWAVLLRPRALPPRSDLRTTRDGASWVRFDGQALCKFGAPGWATRVILREGGLFQQRHGYSFCSFLRNGNRYRPPYVCDENYGLTCPVTIFPNGEPSALIKGESLLRQYRGPVIVLNCGGGTLDIRGRTAPRTIRPGEAAMLSASSPGGVVSIERIQTFRLSERERAVLQLQRRALRLPAVPC